MPVDSLNPEYITHSVFWQVCRDVKGGQPEVHRAGSKYLPEIGVKNTPGFDALNKAYRERTPFLPMYSRTLGTFSGLVFRKEPTVTLPDALDEFRKDVTADGVPLESFAESFFEEIEEVTRAGILVDYQTAPQTDEPLTVAQAAALSLRPFWRLYKAEDVTQWKKAYTPGHGVALTLVVLKEAVEVAGADEFETKEDVQYRVLRLRDGRYMQEVWRRPADGADWAVVEEITPLMNGKPMDFIPFIPCDDRGVNIGCRKPVFLDLAYINLDHFRVMADFRHALRFVGMPTPVITGLSEHDDAPESIGPATIWKLPQGADAKYLQVDAQGLSLVQNELDRIKSDAAAIGTRALAPDKAAAEAADTLGIRAAGENSVIASMALAVSAALTKALRITAKWMGVEVPDDECVFRLNTDFTPKTMDPALIRELVSAVQQGLLSKDSFYSALVSGEIIEPTRDWETEKELIDESMGDGLGMNFNATDPVSQSAAQMM